MVSLLSSMVKIKFFFSKKGMFLFLRHVSQKVFILKPLALSKCASTYRIPATIRSRSTVVSILSAEYFQSFHFDTKVQKCNTIVLFAFDCSFSYFLNVACLFYVVDKTSMLKIKL